MKILKNSPLAKLSEITVKASIIRAIIYTCGHILIALSCNKLITNASLELATLDAIIEPVINGFWFYFLISPLVFILVSTGLWSSLWF